MVGADTEIDHSHIRFYFYFAKSIGGYGSPLQIIVGKGREHRQVGYEEEGSKDQVGSFSHDNAPLFYCSQVRVIVVDKVALVLVACRTLL